MRHIARFVLALVIGSGIGRAEAQTTPTDVQEDFARMFGMTRSRPAGASQEQLALALNSQERRIAASSTLDAYRQSVEQDPLLAYLKNHGGPDMFHVLLWNKFALDLVSIDHTTQGISGMPEATYAEQFGPPRASRALAIVHLAMVEALNTITQRFTSYQAAGATTTIQTQVLAALHVSASDPSVRSANVAAAIGAAASAALTGLYPRKAAIIQADYLATTVLTDTATVHADPAREAAYQMGTNIGQQAAAAILAARAADCSTEPAPKTGTCAPNVTPPSPMNSLNLEPPVSAFDASSLGAFGWVQDPVSQNGHALGGFWGDVTPFALQPHQFLHRDGLQNSYLIFGNEHVAPSETSASFSAALNNGPYGSKICDTHLAHAPKPGGPPAPCVKSLWSSYGIRLYGGFKSIKPPLAVNVELPPQTPGPRWSTYTDRDAANADLTFRANFWGYEGTALLCAPPRLYNMIATSYALTKGPHQITDATDMARYLALVNIGLADAAIAGWDAKYAFLVARPVSYIRDKTPTVVRRGEPDMHWTPLGLVASNGAQYAQTPPFPAYPSGHAVFGAALFRVIGYYFHYTDNQMLSENTSFTFISDEYNGINQGPDGLPRPRTPIVFRSLGAAAWENAESRIWLGVHWQQDADDGVRLGKEIADYIVSHTLQPSTP